jgi:hypothetical protein
MGEGKVVDVGRAMRKGRQMNKAPVGDEPQGFAKLIKVVQKVGTCPQQGHVLPSAAHNG